VLDVLPRKYFARNPQSWYHVPGESIKYMRLKTEDWI